MDKAAESYIRELIALLDRLGDEMPHNILHVDLTAPQATVDEALEQMKKRLTSGAHQSGSNAAELHKAVLARDTMTDAALNKQIVDLKIIRDTLRALKGNQPRAILGLPASHRSLSDKALIERSFAAKKAALNVEDSTRTAALAQLCAARAVLLYPGVSDGVAQFQYYLESAPLLQVLTQDKPALSYPYSDKLLKEVETVSTSPQKMKDKFFHHLLRFGTEKQAQGPSRK